MSAVIIPILSSRKAKARGVALAVACAADRLGLTSEQVIACARFAADRVRSGKASPAKVYSDAVAQLRADQPSVQA